MLSASRMRNACPKCQHSLGALSKQFSRTATSRSTSLYTGRTTNGRFVSRTSYGSVRAFTSSRAWKQQERLVDDAPTRAEDIEEVVRKAKQRFRDTLPEGYLNEEEYAVYVRLYGPPLRVTEPEDVGIPSHADMGAEAEMLKSSSEGTLIRQLEDGEYEEVTYERAAQEVADEEIAGEEAIEEEFNEAQLAKEEELPEMTDADLQGLAQKAPGYVETVARDQREHDAMQKLLQDFEAAKIRQEEQDDADAAAAEAAARGTLVEPEETYWPDEPEDPIDRNYSMMDEVLPGEARRFHPLTIAGRSRTNEISLPREELIEPVRELLTRTHIKHVKAAAEEAFGGRGLPTSPATQEGQKNGKMDPVGLYPGQRHMTEIEGDAWLAASLPPLYASSMNVLRETRKRLGGSKWLQPLLKKPEGPSILDAGAGGGGLIAWQEIVDAEWELMKDVGEARGKKPPGKKTVLAASDRLRDRLKDFLHNTTFLPRLPDYAHSGETRGEHLEAGGKPQQRKTFDVILASHLLLAEKWDHHRQAVLNNLWNMVNPDGGVLIFVEKAHPRGFEAAAHVRDTVLKRYLEPVSGQPTEDQEDFNPNFNRVLEKGQVVAPCTTHNTCPMYKFPGKSKGRKDFCHFSQRFVAPAFYQRMVATQGEVEFSYVSFQRGVSKKMEGSPKELTERAFQGYEDVKDSEDMDMRAFPRLLLPPLKRKKHVTLDVCTPAGQLERWTVPQSFSRLAYHDARKSRWGDIWALGAKTRVPRSVRIGRGADDGGKRAAQDNGPRKVQVDIDGDAKRMTQSEKNAGPQRRLTRRGAERQMKRQMEEERLDDEVDEGELYDDGEVMVDPRAEEAWQEMERREKKEFRERMKKMGGSAGSVR